MINWSRYDTSLAEARYALSNSPMFLMDGLRADPTVQRIANEVSRTNIERALQSAIGGTGTTLSDSVRPYVLVAAASLKGDAGLLSEIVRQAEPVGGWLYLLAVDAQQAPLPPTFRSVPFQSVYVASSYKPVLSGIQTTSVELGQE